MTFSGLASVGLAAGFVRGGWQIISLVSRRLAQHRGSGRSMAGEIFAPLAIGLLRLVLVTGALAYVARALSIPCNSVLAGVGISGLAMALASKDTLASMLGAALLMSERPFRRADMISAGDTLGIVEHVGIRSTRVRTTEGSMIMLPNYRLTEATITNFGTRRHFLVSSTLQVPYSILPEALSAFVEAAAARLAARLDVVPDRTEVAVAGLGPDGMSVEIVRYLHAGSSKEETAIRQALIRDIVRLGDRMNIPIGANHTPRPPAVSLPTPPLAGAASLAGSAALMIKGQ